MHKLLFYNKFIIFPYMFRALMCSSSGGQNCIIQHLISSHPVGGHLVHRLREDSQPQMLYNTTLTSWWWAQQCLKHVQEYIESPLSTRAPDGHLQVWWYQMLHNAISTPRWWAQRCSKHVEARKRLIIKREFVHQVGQLPRLYWDARSAKQQNL